MKSLFYAAAFVLGSIVSNAQLPGFEWARGIGGTNNDVGYSIAVDSYNNVITTGSFNGTVDFDPGPGIYNLSSGAGLGMYILKVDGSGNFVWAKSLAGLVISRCLTMDASGNIYTTGNFYGTVDFDPGTGSYNLNSNPLGSPDAFISKLDKNGDLLWAVKFGGYGVDGGVAIKTDATGNVYTVGNFERTTDFDPGIGVYNIVSGGEQDIFISKLDGSGNFIWARGFGGYRYDYGNAIALDETGNVYITGSFVDNVDFDPGPGNFAMYSSFNGAYVSKLDASGNFVWAKIVGGYTGNGISVDNDANVYTTGNFTGIVDFDPGPNTQYLKAFGDQDAFISKLDQAGNYVWARSFGGTATTSVSIALDAMANVYTIGRFNKIADFDPGPGVYFLSSSGYDDIYISKLDKLGNYVWAGKLGGRANDGVTDIVLDPTDNIYITGAFIDSADFDAGSDRFNLISKPNGTDIFVLKMNQVAELPENEHLLVYPNSNFGNFKIVVSMPLENSVIKIYNSLGALIYTNSRPGQTTVIDITGETNGIYFISLFREDKKLSTKKMIKL